MSKTRSNARGQHHVPCMLQRHFATAGSGKKAQVHVFDKHDGRTFRTSPENILQERDFNTFEFEGLTYCLEDGFGGIEDLAAPALRKIIATRSLADLTTEERAALLVFIALQRVRGVSIRASMVDIVEQIRERIRAEGQDPDTVPQLRHHDDPEQVKLSALTLVSDNLEKFTKSFANKIMLLIDAAPEQTFLLGDTPVVLANQNDTGLYGNLGMEVRGIEIYMPISPELVIAFWCPSIIEFMGDALRQCEESIRKNASVALLGMGADADKVRELHPQLKERAKKIRQDLEAIKQQRPISSHNDHVDYLNSLQIMYAERHIISATDDFALVEKMLSENQNFRRGMRSQLV